MNKTCLRRSRRDFKAGPAPLLKLLCDQRADVNGYTDRFRVRNAHVHQIAGHNNIAHMRQMYTFGVVPETISKVVEETSSPAPPHGRG